MTFEQANQIYYIQKEIKSIEKELADLEAERNYYKSNILSDMPKGKGKYKNPSDNFLEKQQELEDMLQYSLKKLQQERKQFIEFLDTVEDAEIRLILRLRCVNNMHWEDIGAAVGLHRTAVSKKFYNFFKVSHNSHEICDTV